MEEKKKEKPAEYAKDPAKSEVAKKSGDWFFRIFVGLAIVIALCVEVLPKLGEISWPASAAASTGGEVAQSAPQAAKEQRVQIAFLGPDQWSSETFNLVQIKGKKGFFDCPLGAQVLFSDGESGPCLNPKKGSYGVKRGIVKFKGPVGEHVTICWDGECEPEVRAEFPQEIKAEGGNYPQQDLPPHPRGWNITPQSIEQDRLREVEERASAEPAEDE